ncbi:hypothetical protein CBM2637_A200555 [Cupriavidus taiwanensis]|nr:hypothetical protein CBM2637_A200555 [Cupriavidus taiwanensis]SPA38660.1 hypothetical protein CBM2606_A150145 [Cupriavidus taiwanensis]SPA51088.1 protein of unknown function [Cupriavidus taiwanensis]
MDPHEGMVCRQFLIDAEIDALTMQRRAGRAVYRTGRRAGWKFSDFLFLVSCSETRGCGGEAASSGD